MISFIPMGVTKRLSNFYQYFVTLWNKQYFAIMYPYLHLHVSFHMQSFIRVTNFTFIYFSDIIFQMKKFKWWIVLIFKKYFYCAKKTCPLFNKLNLFDIFYRYFSSFFQMHTILLTSRLNTCWRLVSVE